MGIPAEVTRLLPLFLRGLADLLDTSEEKLPAGITGLAQNFGKACFEASRQADTVPVPPEQPESKRKKEGTNPSFPPPTIPVPPPVTEDRSKRPTLPPPRRKKGEKIEKKLPPPPKLPTGI